jgi:hypothetical protein
VHLSAGNLGVILFQRKNKSQIMIWVRRTLRHHLILAVGGYDRLQRRNRWTHQEGIEDQPMGISGRN